MVELRLAPFSFREVNQYDREQHSDYLHENETAGAGPRNYGSSSLGPSLATIRAFATPASVLSRDSSRRGQGCTAPIDR